MIKRSRSRSVKGGTDGESAAVVVSSLSRGVRRQGMGQPREPRSWRSKIQAARLVCGALLIAASTGCSMGSRASEAPQTPETTQQAGYGYAPAMADVAQPVPAPVAPESGGGAFAKAGERAEPVQQNLLEKGGALLVYTADLQVAVYEAAAGLERAEAIAKQVGGHVTLRTNDRIVLRVPRERFEDALKQLAAIGDILQRHIRAEDVGDAYRDLDVRLKNARAVRDRLAELLARAENVADALKVEQELSRVTLEIERLEANIRSLRERIAYSTITIAFSPRPTERVRDEVRELPFPFLAELGLSNLLNLQGGH